MIPHYIQMSFLLRFLLAVTVSWPLLVADDLDSLEKHSGQVACILPLHWNFPDVFLVSLGHLT